MASGDAVPVPRKNVAFRATFPIIDSDGDLVTGAASLDSEVSLDGAAFADCTNEATEIGSSGIYTLDLVQAEMNADTVAVIVKTGTAGAKTTVLIFYPEEAGDMRASVTSGGIAATAFAAGAIDASAIAANAIGASELAADAAAEVAAAVRTELATELGRIDAAITSRSTLTAGQANAEVVDALATDTYAELAAVPAANASLADKIRWLFLLARNEFRQTATEAAIRNDANSASIATAAVSDDATTFKREEWV